MEKLTKQKKQRSINGEGREAMVEEEVIGSVRKVWRYKGGLSSHELLQCIDVLMGTSLTSPGCFSFVYII